MPRIRSIKPEIVDSESMGRVSRDARLLFMLLITQADDEGRLRGNHRFLAHKLFPYDDDAEAQVPRWLRELEAENCIQLYPYQGHTFLSLTNFLRDQKIDKPHGSRLPSPPRLGQIELFELDPDDNAMTDRSSEIAKARARHQRADGG